MGGSDSSRPSARPVGPRLTLSPELKARLEAQRKARGAAAASAPGVMKAVGRRVGPDGQLGSGQRDRRRRPRKREAAESADAEGPQLSDDQLNQMAYDAFKPPDRVTKEHEPVDLTIEDLRADWPVVPSGGEALVEGVMGKMRWMARRLNHGYNTPQELAERLHEGEFMGFESQEEKEQILEAFRERTVQKADRLTDRKGEVVEPEDASFQAMAESERKQFAAQFVKGEYPVKRKHAFPFMTEVDRMLNNNETYNPKQKAQLMDTIEALLPERRRPQASTRAS